VKGGIFHERQEFRIFSVFFGYHIFLTDHDSFSSLQGRSVHMHIFKHSACTVSLTLICCSKIRL